MVVAGRVLQLLDGCIACQLACVRDHHAVVANYSEQISDTVLKGGRLVLLLWLTGGAEA